MHGLRSGCAGALAALVLLTQPYTQRPAQPGAPAPLADHHQHLFGPELAALMAATPPVSAVKPRTAADLVAQLDAAGIRRAVVLSTAYIFEQPSRAAADAETKLRRENDWTSREVARFPQRLIGFCSVNPLKAYALDEVARCARDPHLRRGLKLHFGNSVVDYHDAGHVARVRDVFRAANGHRMTIVAHVRASVTQKLPYGREEALIFLNELLPAAPDVVVQVAHLAGSGSWEDEGTLQAFGVLAEAVAKQDPRTRRLYFDATALGPRPRPEVVERWRTLLSRVGATRLLFGSDAATPAATPREAWTALQQWLPLTTDDLRTIAGNEAPYLARE